ncbi:C40 family peptidase [Cyanobacterium aponinum UTEX 3222]|uniref:NlpC/P60 family protein n=2 Tax=Cyanobacterium aponinum TaxID=379064 RepID=A0A844H0I3_9CHRO|nr:C40 family peptidase [Cyanobacterium aponinum]WRL43074.1 C40 family peptidase [Cyanobacterium aponinum UTEX 3222]MBD2395000.1 C40 family peptidase [Cyanobacterium aponinum FACHB-4101]MTF39885.1 NlpC/P60 family protein [Cyanobacterium aponinum 0216]PHV64361.1 glycoside hydrolase [Cyanobacterium aponinum IPPAS B-1201]WPF88127.1 C40 family peptidase [Cyanobacterium aponinum AL20115]
MNSQLSDLLTPSPTGEYVCLTNLNLYAQPDCKELATQLRKGRYLKVLSSEIIDNTVKVCSLEDQYYAYLHITNLTELEIASQPYQPVSVTREKIETLISQVIEFTYQAMKTPNYYLWGGTVAPNYDCSGLMQSAFASVGVWLPRDSYQQEDFTTRISRDELQRGDLIFFGDARVNHVALYLGENKYIHSSGKEIGNDGIAINQLRDDLDQVSLNYYQKLWSYGRLDRSFIPDIQKLEQL